MTREEFNKYINTLPYTPCEHCIHNEGNDEQCENDLNTFEISDEEWAKWSKPYNDVVLKPKPRLIKCCLNCEHKEDPSIWNISYICKKCTRNFGKEADFWELDSRLSLKDYRK
jgi:hypothetical protein